MIGAHIDEIGFIVTHIDDKGFIRFHTLGGFDPKTLTAQRVIIHGREDIVGVMAAKPIHVMSPEERTKNPKTTDFFIDTGRSKDRKSTRLNSSHVRISYAVFCLKKKKKKNKKK